MVSIIINNKLINIKKSALKKVYYTFAIASAAMTVSALGVQASYESPLHNLVEFSKEKITKVKETKIENPISIENSQTNEKLSAILKQDVGTELSVPSVVTDPAEIEKAVDFAANATGVRKNFIMGLLVVESDLGRNSGKCTYQEVENSANLDHQRGRLSTQAWNTFNERKEIIKSIAQNLGYDYEKLNVSCNPGSYIGTGGAMGIPQFMPDTWMEYKDRISAIVGKENPDPWNEKDAAVAVALKLSDVVGVTAHNRFAERNAAKMYLSGTTSSRYDWYANQILYWAENYNTLIG